jgi:hypothetical protein
MARVYADVNQSMPRSYWDYDSVNISMSSRVLRRLRASARVPLIFAKFD